MSAGQPVDGPEALDRWLGGKRWLVKLYPEHLPLPSPRGRVYDLFTGGGAVALHFLRLGCRVVMGDTNPRLIGAYRWIRNQPERVVSLLTEVATQHREAAALGVEHGAAHFYELRALMNDSDPDGLLSAVLFVFTLRAGFNGLYRVNRRGVCNTTYGEPKPGKDLVRAGEIRALSSLLARAEPTLGDFEVIAGPARRGDFVYADPPYVAEKGKVAFVSYAAGGFTPEDQARLGVLLRDLDHRGVTWLLSDGATSRAAETYGLWDQRRVEVYRSISAKGKGRGTVTELLVSNRRLVRC